MRFGNLLYEPAPKQNGHFELTVLGPKLKKNWANI